MKSIQTNSWVCTVCGFVNHGPLQADTCPVCWANKTDRFETYAPLASISGKVGTKQKMVIVGGSIAGVSIAGWLGLSFSALPACRQRSRQLLRNAMIVRK